MPTLPHAPAPSELPHTCRFQLYGARIAVHAANGRALAALVRVFPPDWKPFSGRHADWTYVLSRARAGDPPTERARPAYQLYSNGELLVENPDLARVIEVFERDIQLAVAQAARGRVFVHAGVVGWRGRAIVLPGKSFAGKSTLVRELVRAGATYYSDEYAVLDGRGRVHPFARPLALRDQTLVNRKLPLAELGGAVGRRPLPVGTILVTSWREGARWHPRRLSPGRGALELLANTVTARTRQALVLETLARVCTQANILKGARGDARTVARAVLASLS